MIATEVTGEDCHCDYFGAEHFFCYLLVILGNIASQVAMPSIVYITTFDSQRDFLCKKAFLG